MQRIYSGMFQYSERQTSLIPRKKSKALGEYPILRKGFNFMDELLAGMCQEAPTKRPTMSEVVARFDQIANNLPRWKACSCWALENFSWRGISAFWSIERSRLVSFADMFQVYHDTHQLNHYMSFEYFSAVPKWVAASQGLCHGPGTCHMHNVIFAIVIYELWMLIFLECKHVGCFVTGYLNK